jgi:dolichyl-phosphate-mannose-protein mannosyltransferase
MSDRTAFVVLILALLLGRFITLPRFTLGLTNALSSRWMPLVTGLVTAVFMAWLWGGLDQVAAIHDEAAYLLQAQLYASGHWTAPGLPLPEFFEQYHVLVAPMLTPKYFPGHALMLVPGIWLGLPGLMPVVMLGVCGALIFAVARRLANPWIGLLAWLLWMTAPGVMEFMPGYLSETTTGVLWMLGWWALLRWLEDSQQKWLLLVAASIGMGFLTRPLTMLVFAVPIGVVVLVRVARRRAWKEVVAPFAIGFAFLGLWFLWCQRTTGSLLHTPWELYRRMYIPDDTFGFGLTGEHPLRALNPDMAAFNEWVMSMHRDYTRAALPSELRHRVIVVAANMWATRAVLLPLAALALIATSAALWFALGTALLLVLTYLSYAHAPEWSVYYIEIQPVLAFATAVGWWRFASIIANRKLAWPVRGTPEVTPNAVFAVLASALLLWPYLTRMVSPVAAGVVQEHEYHRDFRDVVQRAPGEHIMVFIRYMHGHSPHMSLVTNTPDLAAARVWTVYDLGAENVRLMRLDPQRTPYLFDEAHRALVPMDSTGGLDLRHAIFERAPGEDSK